jgi:catechol 2,3-dioxygenase-like lactoylglutathione lyase family enzyme
MTVPARLSIVTLGVDDLPRSVAFYEALGWERSAASQEGVIVWFRMVGSVLGLYGSTSLAEDANLPAEPRAPFGGITLAVNVDREAEVQPALDAAQAAGGTILKPATRAEWGGLSGYFADPDGHPWEVAWNPSFGFHVDGTLDLP